MSIALATLQSLSLAECISILGASIALYAAMREETRDFKRIEDTAAACRADGTQLPRLLEMTERVRRISWRMGICTAAMACLTLMLCGVVPREKALPAALICWVWVTAALNFRAFHVEDPAWKLQNRITAKTG